MSTFGRMGDTDAEHQSATEHDPYARREGYVTSVDGRTDRVTTAAAAGVGAALATTFVLGFFQVTGVLVWIIAAAVGVVVWLSLRARQRRRDRVAGRSPDAVARARDRAIADENGGRRFFVAQNPVVVIVMGGIFLALGVVWAVLGEDGLGKLLPVVLLFVSGTSCVVQGIGTLVVRRQR
jgi:hypothetical protein